MNAGFQDSYNLSWKLGMVMNGVADERLLDTYELERRLVALDLIAFDRKFSKVFLT